MSTPPDVSPEPSPTSTTSPTSPTSTGSELSPAPTRRKRGAGHIVAIVVACLLLLPGFGLLTGGAAVGLAQAFATDDDGYFDVALDRVESDGVAIATHDLWMDDVDDDAGPWVLGWLDVDLRLRVDGAASTDDVFVGIARSADVEAYLAGTEYSEVRELDDLRPRYRQYAGGTEIGEPVSQDFWTVSTVGTGEQVLDWEARGGRWSIVVMNADGSADVAADVDVGVRSGLVTPIAVFLLVTGGITVTLAIVLIVIGVRGRRAPEAPDHEVLPPLGPQPGGPLPPPALDAAAQLDDRLDDDARQPTPVG